MTYWQEDMAKAFEKGMKRRGLSADTSDEDYLKWWEKKLLG